MLENTSWGVEESFLVLFICFYSKHHCQEHRRDGQGGLRQRAITHTRQSPWLPWDTICQQWLSQYVQKLRASSGCMWQPLMPFHSRCLGGLLLIHISPQVQEHSSPGFTHLAFLQLCPVAPHSLWSPTARLLFLAGGFWPLGWEEPVPPQLPCLVCLAWNPGLQMYVGTSSQMMCLKACVHLGFALWWLRL